MRQIGHLDSDKDARTFGDFLYVQGIETEFEEDGGRWAIWVRSDDDLARATELLKEFRANPNDPKYLAGSPAEKLRQQAQKDDAAYRKRLVDGRQSLPSFGSYGFGFVTYTLIVVCIIVAVISRAGADTESISGLFLRSSGLRRGELWRLITPIFIHFGIFHILFNLMWLKDLGSLLEARLGRAAFITFVFATAVLSNVAQFMTRGASFGGMSGVVYGLIGYTWLRGRLDPAAGIHLDKTSWILALIWMIAGFLGWLGPIANYAHLGGLLVGLLWAWIDSRRR
jgi:GlpG protein